MMTARSRHRERSMSEDHAIEAAAVATAIRTRRSVRAFLATPVALPVIREILTLAGCAPSGSNLQPWRGDVVTGGKLERGGRAVQGADLPEEAGHKPEHNYYTHPTREPYFS